jgi:hypothetical protein
MKSTNSAFPSDVEMADLGCITPVDLDRVPGIGGIGGAVMDCLRIDLLRLLIDAPPGEFARLPAADPVRDKDAVDMLLARIGTISGSFDGPVLRIQSAKSLVDSVTT